MLLKFLDHLPFGVQQPSLLEEKRADVLSKVRKLSPFLILGIVESLWDPLWTLLMCLILITAVFIKLTAFTNIRLVGTKA